MDDLPIFFDHVHGVYRLIDTDDTDDSGVEEIPFPASFISEDDEAVCAITESPTSKLFKAYHELEEDDLTYVDDDRDKDYKPNQAVWHQKRGKGKTARRPLGRPFTNHEMIMMTPEKQVGLHREPDSTQHPIRHYARKDRTPRTILKMMERHRESERVRHHTLNESMKDVCLRVPGYDPAVKETKVIQMQRIIGYECFLENTLTSLCSQLGISIKSLKLGTNFITDAMKDTPIENFYKPSYYKTSDIEDEDFLPVKKKPRSSTCKDIHNIMGDRNITRYRRHKISSPTIDSTTGDMVTVITQPINRYGNHSRQHLDGLHPAQTFMPIDSSQESDIKVETVSSPDVETDLQEDIDTLIENGLYQDPDHLTSVTASFMKEEPVTTSAGNDDDGGFTLASPQHSNHSFIFLRSPPRPKGIWHSSHGTNPDHYEPHNTSTEMQSVSPENILETKPKVSSTSIQSSPSLTRSTGDPAQRPDILFIKQEKPDDYFTENSALYNVGNGASSTATSGHSETNSRHDSINVTISGYNSTSAFQHHQQHTSSTSSMHTSNTGIRYCFGSATRNELCSPEKNKRKRYVPYRAQMQHKETEQAKLKTSATASHVIKPVTTQTKKCSTISNLERKFATKKPSNVSSRFPSKAPIKVDHRRASWMNGFMMFCQKNRAQIVRANPGVHHSHIQKIMGHMWRSMSAEEQEPYREKAKQCSNYLKKVQNEVFTEFTESIVDSSLNESMTAAGQKEDPDETAPVGAVSSGSTLFA